MKTHYRIVHSPETRDFPDFKNTCLKRVLVTFRPVWGLFLFLSGLFFNQIRQIRERFSLFATLGNGMSNHLSNLLSKISLLFSKLSGVVASVIGFKESNIIFERTHTLLICQSTVFSETFFLRIPCIFAFEKSYR